MTQYICIYRSYTFSNEKEVVDYVTTMAPLVSLSVILDSIQGYSRVGNLSFLLMSIVYEKCKFLMSFI